MFVRLLDESVLQYNRKYKVIGVCEYQATYVGKFYLDNTWYLRFYNKTRHLYVLLNKDYYYKVYDFVSENPQEKMERRAVNLIVRRLIGDECFEW